MGGLAPLPRVAVATVVLLILAAAGALVVRAALPQQAGTVDLLTQANVQFDGASAHYGIEMTAGAGDVNADGLADVIVGAANAGYNGRANSGSAYVLFGQASPTRVDLDNLGATGFRIDGAGAGDNAGLGVAGVGDMNGDGFADVILSAQHAANNGRSSSGSAYVVFGKASTTTVDLAALGSQGFRIDGAAPDDVVTGVGGAGDLNGDGRPDAIVGAWGADNNGRSNSGSAYVVFGKASTTAVDLASLGSEGFRIDGAMADDYAGFSVGGTGDVNGDGIADVIVSAHGAGNNGRPGSGSAYVVFGKASASTVDLASLGSQGFRIDGALAQDGAGGSVAGAGDVNGDGRPDVILGAPGADNNGRSSSGSAYVVFGKVSTSTVDLASLGSQGFRMDGASDNDLAGGRVAAAGDVNGDGRPDVILGASYANSNGRTDSGAAYVVFGGGPGTTIDLASLGNAGIRIDGGAPSDGAGSGAAGAGDVNGDGRPDVIVGAFGAGNNGRAGSGSAYEIYGFGPASVSYPSPITGAVGKPIPPVKPTTSRTGSASFAVAPALPAGLSIDPSTGVVAGTPTQGQATTAHTVTMTDLSGSATALLEVTVTGGGSGGGAADTAAPTITGFSIAPRKFAVAPAGTPITARAKRGATFRYSLSESSTSTVTISRLLPGRRVGRRCRRPTAKLQRAKSCTRVVKAGKLTRKRQPAGKNHVRFSGRLGRRALAPGKYSATITATDAAGNRAKSRRTTFTIVR